MNALATASAPNTGVNGVALTVFIVLFLVVTVMGFLAARWRRAESMDSLDEWGLGGRGFGTFITWFLLGGDLYTAYTFIAVPAAMSRRARSRLLRRAVHDRGLPDHLHVPAAAVVGLATGTATSRRPTSCAGRYGSRGAVAGGRGHRHPGDDALHRAAAGRHPGRARGDGHRRQRATGSSRTCRCSSRSRCSRPTPTPRACARRR